MTNEFFIDKKNTLIFGLDGAKNLTTKVAQLLDTKIANFQMDRFSNGEYIAKIHESVRNRSCVVVQSMSEPVNDNLMELMILADALKRDSAKEIIAIIPYFAYARQDRRNGVREPITARLVADLLITSGISKIILVDVHTDQVEGFFNIPTDNVSASIFILDRFVKDKKQADANFAFDQNNYVIVAPDYGAVKRVRKLADELHLLLAIVDKKRNKSNNVEIQSLLGDVNNKNCLVFDDVIDTASTIVGACKLIKARGAKTVTVLATHAMLSGNAYKNLKEAFENHWIDQVYFSNSIELKPEFRVFPQIRVVSLDELLARLIAQTQSDTGSFHQVVISYLDDFNEIRH